jgi:hypothetical protein
MFPHSTVPDEFYEHVVRKLDDKAARDQDLSSLVSDGVEAMNRQTGSAWSGLSEEARLEALKRVERTPFFRRLRSDFVLHFYSNPAIWPSSDTKGRLMIKAAISIAVSTTSTGFKEQIFKLCHERSIERTIAWS